MGSGVEHVSMDQTAFGIDSAEKRLNELGYKQELRREMVSHITNLPPFFLLFLTTLTYGFISFSWLVSCRHFSRLLRLHFLAWQFLLGHLSMGQAYVMQDLQAWYGDGLLSLSSLGLLGLPWLRFALLSPYTSWFLVSIYIYVRLSQSAFASIYTKELDLHIVHHCL